MSEEERKKLIYHLRQTAILQDTIGAEAGQAADEIERLAADLSLANDAFDKSTAEIERLATKIKKLEQELELVRRDEERFLYN